MKEESQTEHSRSPLPLEAPEIPTKPAGADFVLSRRVAAALMAILLGWLGVHKFYLREVALGAIYATVSLLSCFTLSPIPAIIGLIEGILYLTMTETEFECRYPVR